MQLLAGQFQTFFPGPGQTRATVAPQALVASLTGPTATMRVQPALRRPQRWHSLDVLMGLNALFVLT